MSTIGSVDQAIDLRIPAALETLENDQSHLMSSAALGWLVSQQD